MEEEELRAHLEGGKDWEKLPTEIPNVFVVKIPETSNEPAHLMVEVNPVDEKGRPRKRRGFYVNTTRRLEKYLAVLRSEGLGDLFKEVDEVNRAAAGSAEPAEELAEEPAEEPELLDWGIPSFKIINLHKYFFKSVHEDREQAEDVVREFVIGQEYPEEHVVVVKFVRKAHRGKRPFDEGGVCYGVYVHEASE
ncbi:MAG: hypothetical protein Kow0069_15780 [Promethearchaeota archaeon]